MKHLTLSSCSPVFLALAILALSASSHAEEWQAEKVEIELPPPSIAQWYKPANKRQVWLHTMFKLREQMAAVELYAERGDLERVQKWAGSLEKTYASIVEMVPEWEKEVNLEAARALVESAEGGALEELMSNTTRLRRSCNSCHRRFAASTTALYRSPDYSQAVVTESVSKEEISYREAMKRMTHTLVELKIARVDGDFAEARSASEVLERQLHDLETSCGDCHRDDAPRERILGAEAYTNLEALRASMLGEHDPKKSGRALGTLGFAVCGRCHSVHRTLGNLRMELVPAATPR